MTLPGADSMAFFSRLARSKPTSPDSFSADMATPLVGSLAYGSTRRRGWVSERARAE